MTSDKSHTGLREFSNCPHSHTYAQADFNQGMFRFSSENNKIIATSVMTQSRFLIN